MRNWIRITAAFAFLFAAVPAAFGQNIAANADQYLSTWARQGRFSGTMLMAKDGKILFRKSYGQANYELNVPTLPRPSIASAPSPRASPR